MLYNASEAHLFRCKDAAWVGTVPILVPDSFSTLGVTTPNKNIDVLEQGRKHLYGTDVCHVAYSGARIDCTFANLGQPFPPIMNVFHDGETYESRIGNWAGDMYNLVDTQSRFNGREWNHLIMEVRLNWKKPAKVSDWIWAWGQPKYSKYRWYTVYVEYSCYYTGWLTGYNLDTISKAPHKHYLEEYEYRCTQYLNYSGPMTTDGDPSNKFVPSSSWDSIKNQPFKLNEKFDFIRDVIHNDEWDPTWFKFNQGPKASAFLKAVEGFPTMDSNSWANMIEIIGLIKDLKRGKFSKAADVPKKWYEWWLQYRYRYSTTKSDVESMAKLKSNLTSFHESFGQYRRNVYGTFLDGDTGIYWRCEVRAVNRAANQIDQIYHGFETLGFDVSIYNLWDLVPYSFVVDWVFPVGDILERMQTNHYLSSDYWDFESICYSASYTRGSSGGDFAISASVYDRWYESHPPNLDQYYWLEEHSKDPSLKTGIFRLIDGLSLLVAGRH